MIPHMSKIKTPQQIAGVFYKELLSQKLKIVKIKIHFNFKKIRKNIIKQEKFNLKNFKH